MKVCIYDFVDSKDIIGSSNVQGTPMQTGTTELRCGWGYTCCLWGVFISKPKVLHFTNN